MQKPQKMRKAAFGSFPGGGVDPACWRPASGRDPAFTAQVRPVCPPQVQKSRWSDPPGPVQGAGEELADGREQVGGGGQARCTSH